MTRGLLSALAGIALAGAACGNPTPPPAEPMEVGVETIAAPSASGGDSAEAAQRPTSRRVDPRRGGFEIGFGEFAVTLEAAAIRPGPVTFVVRNGGKLVHGFEMEAEGPDEDNSGPGGGGDDDGFKIETNTIDPGQSIRFDLDLAPGLYKVECFVANHDDLGMEIMLEVRKDAPLVRQDVGGGAGDAVAITGFAFDPPELQVAAGTEVTWTNEDPAAHTVTADDGSFDSGTLDQGQTFAATVDQSGAVTYFCAIHPTMKGTITVG